MEHRAGFVSGSLDVVVTRRLRAERMTMEHLPDVTLMHRDECFMVFLGGIRSEEQTLAYLERNVTHWERYGFGMSNG